MHFSSAPLILFLLATAFSADCCGDASNTGENVCTLSFQDSTIVYLRPDSESAPWSWLAAGESVLATARTSEGWLGFDPGVAQAGNTGSFRFRWIAPGDDYSVQGDTALLSVVWAPGAGTVYVMTFEGVPVHEEPDTLSLVVDSLPPASAAAILARDGQWLLLNLLDGSLERADTGWVMLADVSVNGLLDSVPSVEDQDLP